MTQTPESFDNCIWLQDILHCQEEKKCGVGEEKYKVNFKFYNRNSDNAVIKDERKSRFSQTLHFIVDDILLHANVPLVGFKIMMSKTKGEKEKPKGDHVHIKSRLSFRTTDVILHNTLSVAGETFVGRQSL